MENLKVVCQLDLEDIDSAKILFQAKEKDRLNWETMNKLCESNPGFESFIDNIAKDFSIKTIRKDRYDEIIDEPQDYIDKKFKQ